MNAQDFQDINAGLTGVGRSAAEWADFDRDGDLDLLVSGIGAGEQLLTLIYRNDSGEFNDHLAGLPGMKEASAGWGDFDNDGDLDLALAGNTQEGDRTYLYRNEAGTFVYHDGSLPGISNGALEWGDYDNDGDLDIFIAGNWMGKLYENAGGSFVYSGSDFGYWASVSTDWGDFDNDGDLDMLISGDSGAGAVTKLYRNTGGVFTEAAIVLEGLMAGTAEFIDYDNDGDLDLSLSGFDDALEARFCLYENLGDDIFEIFWAGIEGVALGSVEWGDYDNDGDLDMIMSGKATGCGAFVSGLYRNDGPYFFKVTDSFIITQRSDLGWADYDNDGDLDFVTSGLTTTEIPVTRIYRNTAGSNAFKVNENPQPPAGIYVETEGNSVIFSWERATDTETPPDGLYYNMRLGTTEEGCEVVPCMSHPETGLLKLAVIGNACQDTSWRINDLEAGTYYFSLQAVDQAFAGSEFAAPQSFTITTTGLYDSFPAPYQDKVFPNPAGDFINLDIPGGADVEIINASGQPVRTITVTGDATIDISGFERGIYFARIIRETGVSTVSFLKN